MPGGEFFYVHDAIIKYCKDEKSGEPSKEWLVVQMYGWSEGFAEMQPGNRFACYLR